MQQQSTVLQLVSERSALTARPAMSSVPNLNSQIEPSEHPHSEGISMKPTLGNRTRIFHGDSRVNITDRKQRNQDWLARKAAEKSEKEIAALNGMSPRAVGNLRQRRNKISFDNFVDWCLNDPHFMAEFAEYVGFIKPGSAAFAAAMTRAVSEYNKLVPE